MYISLTTGNDSLAARPSQGDATRNVSVRTFCYSNVPDQGKHIIPMFRAHQLKSKGYGEQHIAGSIPATSMFSHNDVGKWIINRHEVVSGSEILVEYRHRDPYEVFSEEVEYLLLVANDKAALQQVRLTLPQHSLSNVPYVSMEGRFEFVWLADQISKNSIEHWRYFFGLDEETSIEDILEPNLGWDYFYPVELEPEIKATSKQEVIKDKSGKSRVKIRRVRRVKTN